MMKVVKENLDEIIKWANLLFLFLFSLHLYDFPDKFIILWCVFSGVIFFTRQKKTCVDTIFWFLTFAIILNGLGTFHYLGYSWKDILKMVVPTILIYPFMRQVAFKKTDRDIEMLLLAIALGTFLYSVLNYYSFCQTGKVFLDASRRAWRDFWTGYCWSATHYSFWGCFIVGLVGYGIACLFEKKWLRGIFIILFIIIENYIHIVVDNRMVLCVTIFALLVSLLQFVLLNIRDKSKLKKILMIIMIVAIVVGVVFIVDPFGIQSTGYYQRFVTRDGGIFKNVRFQMIFEAIALLPSHWKGGANMWVAGLFSVHNYWLQVANVSGIIPFILWMIVNVSAVTDVVKIVRNPYISDRLKYMLIPMLAAVVGYLMMEPGSPESNRYIIFYVMLIALLKQIVKNNQKVEKKLEC